MEPITWTFLGTLGGAVVGAVTSIATTTINSRNVASLQLVKVNDEREERRRTFQRETILEVQDCFYDLLRLATRLYLADLIAFKASQNWGLSKIDADLDEGFRLQNQKLSCLLERIFDEDLRNQLRSLHRNVSSIATANSREEAEAIDQSSSAEFRQTMTALGAVLRSNY
ncbi:hypothetical protein [Duganella levis]|uniref:Uncharacterized protein n=1 Tax=Duganella levis TaxID=2692169 RepID=A0ABW9VTW3_9BURK|nr:hypothetical protein [Duganella levis]MYN25069.1 hypothetical protein [Duganella levis]